MNLRHQGLGSRLLLRLMLPLLLAVSVTAGVGIFSAQSLTQGVFDRWLLDAAQSLAHQIRFTHHQAQIDLPQAAQDMLAYDDIDSTSFSVSQQDRLLLGQIGIATHGTRESKYIAGRAFDAHFGGNAVRVAAVEVDGEGGDTAIVLVAETMRKRERAQHWIAVMLVPMGLLLAAAAFAIHFAVVSTVKPLESIAKRWDERSHASLEPIGAEDVPQELMPFATALNDLLLRMRSMLERERQFAATAAHQLRTPLTGLQLGLARAAEAPDLASTRKVLRELEQSTLRAARLVQQLLMFGRLDPESAGELGKVPTDLVELARDVGATFIDIALTKSIDLELIAPQSPISVDMQPDLVAEALANLLDNALQHTPTHGHVAIHIRSNPPAIHVDDSGAGVPENERQSIFERFSRGRDATGAGSGLGLAIARDIASLHGATLSVSPSMLGGASFQLEFRPIPFGDSGPVEYDSDSRGSNVERPASSQSSNPWPITVADLPNRGPAAKLLESDK